VLPVLPVQVRQARAQRVPQVQALQRERPLLGLSPACPPPLPLLQALRPLR